jgi:hypothetical protein
MALSTLSVATSSYAQRSVKQCLCSGQHCLRLGQNIQTSPRQTIEGYLTTREAGAFILNLDAPACAKGSGDPSDDFDGEDIVDQIMIHVAPMGDATLAKTRAAVGKRVRLYGFPFGAHTAWHKTPMVFSVVDLEIVR